MLTNGYGNYFAPEIAKTLAQGGVLHPFSLLFRALFSDELSSLPPAYAKKFPDVSRYSG